MNTHNPKYRTALMLLLMSTILTFNLFSACTVMNAHGTDSSSAPQANSWSSVAPKPTNCWQLAAVVVNGKIYAISGIADTLGPVLLNTTEEFDPDTNTWTAKASMPFPTAPAARFPFGVAADNGKIYAVGVINYSSPIIMSVLAYDTKTDTWESRKPMPINASVDTTVIANTVDGKIYVMGNGADGIFGVAKVLNEACFHCSWAS